MSNFSLTTFLLFAILCCITCLVSAAKKEDTTPNVFKPISAIVTKNGGAIATLEATLNPPLTSEGYHDVSISWCPKEEWQACLDSKNATNKCRCGHSSLNVEESVRFNLDSDDEDDDVNVKNNKKSLSSQCSVVSQRWESDPHFEDVLENFKESLDLELKTIQSRLMHFIERQRIIDARLRDFDKKENVTDDISKFVDRLTQLQQAKAVAVKNIANLTSEQQKIVKRRNRSNLAQLGRVMRLEIFCSSSSSNKKIINFSELKAQATFSQAKWEPSHTLLIDTRDPSSSSESSSSTKDSSSSSSEVRMAAKISQSTHMDWKDVKMSLRQGAPGEDTTTTEDAPNDEPLEPWVLTVKNHAPTPPRDRQQQQQFMNQRNLNQDNMRSKKAMPSKAKAAPGRAGSGAVPESAASFSGAVFDEEREILVDEEDGATEDDFVSGEEGMDASSPTILTQDPASATEIVGSFTEETKLPHRVSILKNSHSIVEIGRGKVSSTMNRVAAAHRCRQNIVSSSYNNQKKKSVCRIPVFLRANVTNTNKFSILGGPTRVIVDGVPHNPFGRAKISASTNYQNNLFQQQQQRQQNYGNNDLQQQNSASSSFRSSIAPNSWNFVDLGEDTRITIQRYEKSNIMSGSAAQRGKGFWEKLLSDQEERNSVSVKFEMKVTNSRKTSVTIDLRDQFPRTNSDEIEIKLDDATLRNKFLAVKNLASPNSNNNNQDGDDDNNNNRGNSNNNKCAHPHPSDKSKCISTRHGGEELQWNVDIGASSTVTIPFGFTVTWPKKKFVHGLI